ncbi:MAG: hypothetical protein JNL54_05160 [Kineosporiaceae bacterium]|nr:hypothetical protein [Kineosporiaceae bacterium]
MTESAPSLTQSSPSLATALDDDWELTIALSLAPDAIDALWPTYRDAFDDLQTQAAQRHLMTRSEFDQLMTDERVDKIVIRDRRLDRVAALSIMTNHFDAVPLVSAEYFRARWPREFEDGRVWYVGFVAIPPAYQGSRAIGSIIRHVVEQGGSRGGVFAVDICDHNAEVHRLPEAIARLGRAFHPGVRSTRLDAQVYWAYEVPPRPEPASTRSGPSQSSSH